MEYQPSAQKKGFVGVRTGVRQNRAAPGGVLGRGGGLHRQGHRGDGQIYGVGGAAEAAGSRSPSKANREMTEPVPVDAITIPPVPVRRGSPLDSMYPVRAAWTGMATRCPEKPTANYKLARNVCIGDRCLPR